MSVLRIYLIFFALVLHSCTSGEDDGITRDENGDIVEGVLKQYARGGILEREVSYKNGKLNGVAKMYYRDGKIKTEVHYENGLKEGKALRYYKEGGIYRDYFYHDNKFEGIQRKYHRNGKLMSELVMVNGNPTSDIKEYYTSGKLKEMPVIEFETVDRLAVNGYFALNIRMSDNSKKVKFYLGKLDKDGCLSPVLDEIFVENGVGLLDVVLNPGEYIEREVHVVANQTTMVGNSYLSEASYNLSIRNPMVK